MSKKALITGIAGQDGAYLAYYLTKLGYSVYGVCRRNSDLWRLKTLFDPMRDKFPDIIFTDISESQRIDSLIAFLRPDEIYNLAAQSHVGFSFDNPKVTMDVNYGGLVNIIEAVKKIGLKTKIYQAGTSELFGYNNGKSLNEESPLMPKSPYAVAKLAAHWAGINARKEGVWVSNGILFNHESPLRGEDFVTRKITIGVGKIKRGEDHVIELGNLEAQRDWGFAGDYVEAMHKMLQHDEPDDFVIGTGQAYSVADFLYMALAVSGLDVEIKGKGIDEVWYSNDKPIVKINKQFYRPNEVHCLVADPEKSKVKLAWQAKTSFENLVKMMVEADQ
jgi:GDPmannose 4,6-dehydratase